MKYKYLVLVVVLVFSSVISYGQLLAWDVNAAAGNEASVNPTFANGNLTTSALVRNGSISATALVNTFNSSNFPVGEGKAAAMTNNRSLSFTMAVNSGFTTSLTTLDAKFRRSSTGPNAFAWYYSLDGTTFTQIGSDISFASTATGGTNQAQLDLSVVSALQSVATGTTITFRLYCWGATNTGGTFALGRSLTSGEYCLQIGGSINVACTQPATPAGTSITGTTPACNSTTLTYAGAAPPANITNYWQYNTTTGTSTTNDAASTLSASVSGNYYVRAKNTVTGCWSATSYGPYAVVINVNPTTTDPAGVSIVETNNTSFNVTATNPGTYTWQVSIDGGGVYNNVSNGGVYSGATTATLTLTAVPITMNGYLYKCIISPIAPCGGFAVSNPAMLTVTSLYSSASDIVAIASSEPATISSTVNNVTITTSSNGVQVWQIRVRDGGGSNDADTASTILTAFTIAQAAGNAVTTWSDAIYSIGLFDGTTFVANGTVTLNQIQFSGLNVIVADNGFKDLYLRLSLKCPMGSGAKDGDDFGFSISSANTTFSNAGSGKSAFGAATSANSYNVIDVVATKLLFTTQPTNTGQNNTMTTVVVSATDACGNVDLGFTGTVSLTSTGTMTAVTPVAAVAGVATFSTITHTATGTGFTLSATSTVSSIPSSTFDINVVTALQPGDVAILAFSTAIATGDDEISFVTFVDITPGTRIDMTDNAYQKCGTPNGWGLSEGWIRVERANTTLPKGTIITVNVNTSGVATVVSPDPSNWVCSKPQPSLQGTFNLNNTGEQIFFLSGGTVGGTNATTATSDGGTYSGTILYGFNTKGNVWTPICGNSAAGGTQNSDKPKSFDCFLTWPTTQADLDKYTGPMTPATERDWVARISDSANWTGYANNAAYTAGPNFYGASISIIVGGYSAGVWIGDKDTNWFECSNWQSRKVPDATVDVSVGVNAVQGVTVDATAANASAFSFLAQCKDLAISTFTVKAEGSASNILEVNGNLSISASGTLDMDDSNAGTADGQINLYGNWTNSVGNTAFSEGNGTVQFTGSGTQIINNVTPEGTETFYNVILNNNFDTSLSNDLIASGNLTVNASKTLTVDSAGFVRVNSKLTNNGNVFIDTSGQLIQVDDTDTNNGTYTTTRFQVKRTAMARNTDYVYWSSPLNSFDVSGVPTSQRYIWDTAYNNTNGTQGYWTSAAGAMTIGKGYIARASNGATTPTALSTTFSGSKPNNGLFNYTVYRGNYTAGDYDADATNALNVDTTKYDDNWNLVGNPYPSAIDAEKFLVLNQSVIEGSVWIWKHGLLPNSTSNPFYANFQYNYTDADYIKYNGLGSTEPDTFAGKIASGQGFMVNMKDVGSLFAAGANTNLDVYSGSISFNNSLRSDSATNPYMPYNNSDFYKTANNTNVTGNPATEEKHRIWLDIIDNTTSLTDRALVGYSTNSTLGRDTLYDCFFVPRSEVCLYSLINEESFIIQGRPLPFDPNDKVPLGVSIISAGNHTIAIRKLDGTFVDNTDVYIEDKLLNIIHDLKQSPYVFSSQTGVFNDRFVLRYNNEALATPGFESLDNSVVASSNHGELSIKSYVETMQDVTVFDILGRQLFEANHIDANDFSTSNISMIQQALIVKIKLTDGTVVTRKIIL